MSTNTIPITKHGAELLKEELTRVKHVERPAVINAIAEARAQGDLSENAEYEPPKRSRRLLKVALKSSRPNYLPHKLLTLHYLRQKVVSFLEPRLNSKILMTAKK